MLAGLERDHDFLVEFAKGRMHNIHFAAGQFCELLGVQGSGFAHHRDGVGENSYLMPAIILGIDRTKRAHAGDIRLDAVFSDIVCFSRGKIYAANSDQAGNTQSTGGQ